MGKEVHRRKGGSNEGGKYVCRHVGREGGSILGKSE